MKRLYPSGVGLSSSWGDLSEAMARVDPLIDQARQILRQGPVEFPVNYAAGLEVRLPHLNAANGLSTWFDEAIRLKLH